MRCIEKIERQQGGIFMTKVKQKMSVKALVMAALLTALVVVLEWFAGGVKLGFFTINLALVPIVIGAAICGVGVGAWLGLTAGFIILVSGQAAGFMVLDPVATVIVVLVKGVLSGYFAGVVYKLLEKVNTYLAVVLTSIVCPLVNTGVFFIGCLLFFMEHIAVWAGGTSAINYTLTVLIGFNFIAEMVVNIILTPVIIRLINIRKKV